MANMYQKNKIPRAYENDQHVFEKIFITIFNVEGVSEKCFTCIKNSQPVLKKCSTFI